MNDQGIEPRQGALPKDGAPRELAPVEKLIHLALPVRLIHMRNDGRGGLELACTYDIHTRGARLRSSRDLKVGDLVTVERGRNKSVCQVVWTADPGSPLRGQFTVECVEGGKIPWAEELRQMEEQYLPVIPVGSNRKPAMNAFGRGEQNRRRRPRYPVEGGADLAEIGGQSRQEGRLEQISEYGCLISAADLLTPGTGLRLVLNMCDVSVALRGHVRYTAGQRAMGVEFEEIRQGDRPLLDYVLNRLRKPRTQDFADLEVVTEPLAAAAG
ncbi:MAG: PilZ domain-containing protein [Candidatus Sulfotelmatobacter sp.]